MGVCQQLNIIELDMPFLKLEPQTLIYVSELILTKAIIRVRIFHLLEVGPAHPMHTQVKLFFSFAVSIDLKFDGAIVAQLQTEVDRIPAIARL